MTNTEQYDYEAIHRAVCPDPSTLTRGQRESRVWPSAKNMNDFLSLLGSEEWQKGKDTTPFSANKSAYYQAMNNGLLTVPRHGWDGNRAPTIKHSLTEKGRAYLLHLKVISRKSSPKPDTRATLRKYERRFNSATRWAVALHPPLTPGEALNVLYEAHSAHVIDTRALMAGAI